MSNWKKIVVSGSGAHLSSVTASNGSVISGSLTMSGSINNVDHLNFYTTSSAATATGRLVWNDGDGTLDLGLKGGTLALQLGQDSFARVYNAEATTLNKGEIVYISGSQGNRISVKRADSDIEAGSANTLGMVSENISSGAEGFVFTSGIVNGLNTNGLTAGATLYLSSSGQYTQIPPVAPKHTVIIGFVERVHATVGSIFVKVNNGYELGELHNVLTNGANYGDFLMYSASVWTHSKQLSGSYGLTGSLQATSFTGSLQGTATTASYVLNAVSSSFATTASYVLGGGGVSDGDKGDITVSSGGSTWTIDNDVVTYAKMQNITPGILGRNIAGTGDISTITALTDYHVLQWISGIPSWSPVTTNNILINNNNRIIGKGTGTAAELSLGNGLAITGTTLFVTSSAFTGSLQGSASYALTASGVSISGPTTGLTSYYGNGTHYMLVYNGTTNNITGSDIITINPDNETLDVQVGIEMQGGASITTSGTIYANNGFYVGGNGWTGTNISATASYAATASRVSTLNQNVTVSGSVFLSGSLHTPVFVDYEEKYTTINHSSAGGITYNLSNGNIFYVNQSANITSTTITNPPTATNLGSFTVILDSGTTYTVAWPASVKWPVGGAPLLEGPAVNIVSFITPNGGTDWYGFVGGLGY